MGIHFVFNTVFGFLTLLRFNGGQGLGTSVEVCWRSLQTHHQDVHCCSDRVPFTADNSSKQCYVIVFTKYTHTHTKKSRFVSPLRFTRKALARRLQRNKP